MLSSIPIPVVHVSAKDHMSFRIGTGDDISLVVLAVSHDICLHFGASVKSTCPLVGQHLGSYFLNGEVSIRRSLPTTTIHWTLALFS